jgi:peptidyl-prolyl cis-trans isomerase SurA
VKKKRVQEKTRFDRGGRFSANRPVAKPVAAVVPAATAATGAKATSESYKKPKKVKIKREKIRFGQAPRQALPPGPLETSTGNDQGTGAASAAVTPGGIMGEGDNAAPGTAIAPVTSGSITDADYNPLNPRPEVQKKTRFSDRAKTEKVEKAKARAAKAQEKAAAAPAPETAQEKVAQQVQSAPLGLNGDTVKKKKKKKVKGGKKERLQQQAPKPPPPPPVETPAIAPDRGTPLEGTPSAGRQTPAATPAPSSSPN